MQLILISETDIGINTKMSVIEQENLTQSFKDKSVTSDLDIEVPNINEKTIKENDLEIGKQEVDMETENTEINDNEKLPNENVSKVDTDLIKCNSSDQYQNEHTSNKDSEEIKKMDVEKVEDIKNVEKKCEDIDMTDLQANEGESSSKQFNKEDTEAVEEIDRIVYEDKTEKRGDILQENSTVESAPLETDLQVTKPNIDDSEVDSDVLKLDFDDSKQESDKPKTDCDDPQPNSDEPKSDSDKLRLDFDDSKTNSDEPKINHNHDGLKIDFHDSKLNSNDPNAVLQADSEFKIQDSNNLKIDTHTPKLDTVDSKIDSKDEKTDTENLKTDFDGQKPDSDILKSDTNNLTSDFDKIRPDATEVKPHSDDPESDSINIKLDSDDPKTDSTNMELDSDAIKLDSDDLKKDYNNVKSGSSNDTETLPSVKTIEGDIPNEEESKTIDSENISEESKSVESEKAKECADSESVQENNEVDHKVEVNQIKSHLTTVNTVFDTVVQKEIANTEIKDKNDKEEIKVNEPTKKIDPKKLSHICKLSNTLDILSDEEEESSRNKESHNKETSEKQCIQIEDDDDIMLIDENNTSSKVENNNHEVKESFESPPVKNEVEQTSDDTSKELPKEKDTLEVKSEDTKTKADLKEQRQEEKPADIPKIPKSLLPVTFLKTCKKNLADMTREELEEFCILKIVESVVDRSNLSEIKTQLKVMAQNIEEHKKKAFMLTKQNRDLQVVLKSVQEEQKKKTDLPITPLKITRSVGMQVFMTDKTVARRKSALGSNIISNTISGNSPANKQNKSHINQSPKTPKNQANANNTQQIPVPKLVPANHLNNSKVQTPSSNASTKTSATPTTPNGIRNSPPVQKPVKRPLNKAGNSVTVDLTDDEPPSKIVQLNVNPPVRLVPPQNLLAQRQPFVPTINSPRKVYIPISGSQNQVRPGQTIMLRQVGPQGPRQRGILPKQHANSMRMNSLIPSRHPAPLPDCMKQYQPPNWKSLPPAPELKLSKVENGIVISWKIDGYQEDNHEEIASYQLYAYQETSSPPSTTLWKKIGDVKALPLPMACTLTQFMAGYKYYFAVRAVDIRSRLGPFSAPGSILLLNKM